MSVEYGIIIEGLTEIKIEIQNQLAKEDDRQISMTKLIELSSYLANKSILSKLPSQEANALDVFAKRCYFKVSLRENLKTLLDDVNKLLSLFSAKLPHL